MFFRQDNLEDNKYKFMNLSAKTLLVGHNFGIHRSNRGFHIVTSFPLFCKTSVRVSVYLFYHIHSYILFAFFFFFFFFFLGGGVGVGGGDCCYLDIVF